MVPDTRIAPRKRCLVAIDAPSGPVLLMVELPTDASIAAALVEARRLLEAGARSPDGMDWAGIDWAGPVGIWGRCRDRAEVPADNDRIELYRPLAMDPRQRRRARLRSSAQR
jgi:putative ubiquitin-RnfH superfamily antitoxin RatB of RatAB toxin-antitoxin module